MPRAPRRALLFSVTPTVLAAVLGNALIGRDALRWFRDELDHPATMPPFPLFLAVGIAYYSAIAVVLYRSLRRRDDRSARLALLVLVLNEVWNVAFFGRRSTRNGFFGIVAFSVPLAALQASLRDDRISSIVLAPYSIWVAYDLVWTYQLWRRNPARSSSPTYQRAGSACGS